MTEERGGGEGEGGEGGREPPARPAKPSIMDLFQGRKGKMDVMEYLIMSRELAREERAEERYEWERQQRTKPTTPPAPAISTEDIKTAVTEGVKAALPARTTSEDEGIPKWAKELQDQQKNILDRLAKEEEERKTKKIIEEATAPLKTELDQERGERKKLEATVEELKPKPGTETPLPQKTPMDAAKDALALADNIRGEAGGGTRKRGKSTETDVALSTVEKSAEVVKDAGKGIQETVDRFIEWQIQRERTLYQKTTPRLPELTPEQQTDVLKKAAEATEAAKTPEAVTSSSGAKA